MAHILLVFFVALFVDTWRTAIVNMVLQTWFIFTDSYAFFCDRKAASSWLLKLLVDLPNGVHAANIGGWPKEKPHLFIDIAGL